MKVASVVISATMTTTKPRRAQSALALLLLLVAAAARRASATDNLYLHHRQRNTGSHRRGRRPPLVQHRPVVDLRGGAAAAAATSFATSRGPNGPTATRASSTSSAVTATAVTAATVYSDAHIPAGTADSNAEIFNLVKSIVGAGVLGLPAGIAAFGNAPSALLPAVFLLVAIGCAAAHGFCNIGTICRTTASTSYKQAWGRSVGTRTAWMPAVACLMVTLCTVLTYSMILADTVPAIVQTVTMGSIHMGRTAALLAVTVFVILPLCLLRSLAALAPFSLLGILGMVFTGGAMVVRWLTGAYSNHGGKFTATLAQQYRPVFGNAGYKSVVSNNAAILVSMLSTAYMAHYNAPKFYWDLKDRNEKRYNAVVWKSFAGAMALMIVITTAGFATFGGASQSLILNNYAASDALMSLSRAAVTLSLIFSYPLAFVGVREGLLDLASVPESKRRSRPLSDLLTVTLLAAITGVAYLLTDIRVILSLGGATWGNLLVYVFPALMMIGAARSNADLQGKVPLSVVTGILGLGMGVVGTIKAVQSMQK